MNRLTLQRRLVPGVLADLILVLVIALARLASLGLALELFDRFARVLLGLVGNVRVLEPGLIDRPCTSASAVEWRSEARTRHVPCGLRSGEWAGTCL